MLYEIVNPSDPYTIDGEESVVVAAVLLLGSGAYFLTECDSDKKVDMPFLLFDGTKEDLNKWWDAHHGVTFEAFLVARIVEIKQALATVLIGSASDRRFAEKTLAMLPPDKRDEWLADYKERKRSSLNNIGACAEELAESLQLKD